MRKTLYPIILGLSTLANLANARDLTETNKVPYYQITPDGITSTASGQRDIYTRTFFFNSKNTPLNPDGEIYHEPLRLTNNENFTFSINLNHNPYHQPRKKETDKIEVLLSSPNKSLRKLSYTSNEQNRISGELNLSGFKPGEYNFVVMQAKKVKFRHEIEIR